MLDRIPSEYVEILTSRAAYEYYREHRSHVAKEINQYERFEKAVNAIFREIKTALIESKGGVHIKELGYFFNLYIKHKKLGSKARKGRLDFRRKPKYKQVLLLSESFYGQWNFYIDSAKIHDHKKNNKKFYEVYKFHLDWAASDYDIQPARIVQKQIVNTETGEIYKNLTEANAAMGFKENYLGNLYKSLNGEVYNNTKLIYR